MKPRAWPVAPCGEAGGTALRFRLRWDIGAAIGQEHFWISLEGQGAQADGGAAGSGWWGGSLAGVFGEGGLSGLSVADSSRSFLSRRVGGFLHEGAGGEDEDFAWGSRWEAVGSLDEGAALALFGGGVRGVGGTMRISGWGWMRMRATFLSVSRRSSRMATAAATCSSRSAAEAMRGAVVADAAEGGEGLAVERSGRGAGARTRRPRRA